MRLHKLVVVGFHVSIPKRVSEALNLEQIHEYKFAVVEVVSIPKRVSEALNPLSILSLRHR